MCFIIPLSDPTCISKYECLLEMPFQKWNLKKAYGIIYPSFIHPILFLKIKNSLIIYLPDLWAEIVYVISSVLIGL